MAFMSMASIACAEDQLLVKQLDKLLVENAVLLTSYETSILSRIALRFHRCSLRKQPTTVPVR